MKITFKKPQSYGVFVLSFVFNLKKCWPVRWGCRIHWLHFCRGERPPPPTCVLIMTLNNLMVKLPVMLVPWGIRNTPSLPLLPGPLWPSIVAPDGSNRTNGILMLNWIVWLNWIAQNRNVFHNQTVLTFKLHAYARLNYLKLNCFWYWNCTFTKLNCYI